MSRQIKWVTKSTPERLKKIIIIKFIISVSTYSALCLIFLPLFIKPVIAIYNRSILFGFKNFYLTLIFPILIIFLYFFSLYLIYKYIQKKTILIEKEYILDSLGIAVREIVSGKEEKYEWRMFDSFSHDCRMYKNEGIKFYYFLSSESFYFLKLKNERKKIIALEVEKVVNDKIYNTIKAHVKEKTSRNFINVITN